MVTFRLQFATPVQQAEIKTLVRAARINPMGLDWRRFVVALDGHGTVIGCGQLKPHRDGSTTAHQPGSWELASIVVAPDRRVQGVARAVIEYLPANSPRPLWLTCMSVLVPVSLLRFTLLSPPTTHARPGSLHENAFPA